MKRKRLPPHIAGIDYVRIFAPAFRDVRSARRFYRSLHDAADGGPRHIALLIFNQIARLLWLADHVHKVSRGRPALQIMFLMIAAEAAAKLFYSYKGHSDSKRFAQCFFLSICAPAQRVRLVATFRELGPSADAITSQLYKIRCQVVHRWEYYGSRLQDDDARALRAIVLEGAAHAARTLASREGNP